MKRSIMACLAGMNAANAIVLLVSGNWRLAIVAGTGAALCWMLRTKVE